MIRARKLPFLTFRRPKAKHSQLAFRARCSCPATSRNPTPSPEAVAEVKAKLGPVRVLINNAANDDRKFPQDIDAEYWDWSMDVNLRHQFLLAKEVMPQMKELGGGSIVNFSSIAWRFGADAMTGLRRCKVGSCRPSHVHCRAIMGHIIFV